MINLTPITEPEKLEEYFRFRYRIYNESRLSGFLNADGDGQDHDAFDNRAMHFGWYMNGKLVGCVRFIEPDGSEEAIPMLAFAAESTAQAAVRAYIDVRRARGERMVEASRFCLAPEYRGLQAAKEFVYAMLRAMLPYGVCHGLFDCKVHHGRFYEALGFEALDGCGHVTFPFLSDRVCVKHYDLERMLATNAELRESMGFNRGKAKKAA